MLHCFTVITSFRLAQIDACHFRLCLFLPCRFWKRLGGWEILHQGGGSHHDGQTMIDTSALRMPTFELFINFCSRASVDRLLHTSFNHCFQQHFADQKKHQPETLSNNPCNFEKQKPAYNIQPFLELR